MPTSPAAEAGDPSELRHRLVEQLRAGHHIRSAAVERAFRTVPRHVFAPEVPSPAAYASDIVATRHSATAPSPVPCPHPGCRPARWKPPGPSPATASWRPAPEATTLPSWPNSPARPVTSPPWTSTRPSRSGPSASCPRPDTGPCAGHRPRRVPAPPSRLFPGRIREPGMWSLLGGGREPQDTALEHAVRSDSVRSTARDSGSSPAASWEIRMALMRSTVSLRPGSKVEPGRSLM